MSMEVYLLMSNTIRIVNGGKWMMGSLTEHLEMFMVIDAPAELIKLETAGKINRFLN